MNRALFYLWITLLKRRVLRFFAGLRRPATLVGFAAVASFIAFIFHYRHEALYAQLVRRESLIGGVLIMVCGSLFTGFRQRGLVFEPPDVEFLFTGPFTRGQIILYRLLPGYLYAVIQAIVFLVIFASHLKHPLLLTACLALFQIACFHLSAGAAIFAGTISDDLHYRLRWMMLGFFAFVAAFYFHTAWGLKVVPAFASSSLMQVFFYPAVSIPDLTIPPLAAAWTRDLFRSPFSLPRDYWQSAVYLAAYAAIAGATLWWLLKLKGDIFEPSLATTSHAAEKRLLLQQGRSLGASPMFSTRSFPLPGLPVFRGVGAIVWKNLIVAFRSRRELAVATAFTLIYTGFLVALRWTLRHLIAEGGALPASEIQTFDEALVTLLFFLSFFLQRTLPFDFRRDGNHLVAFRTLPVGSLALTLAELAVPTGLCLVFQAIGLVILLAFARFAWYYVLPVLLIYPAVSITVNGVWNLHYLLAATRRAGGKAESASAVTMIMIVALSFCMFFPAIWTAQYVGRHVMGRMDVPLAVGAGIAVQYLVDFLLLLLLARIFQRFEVSREFQ